MNFFYQQVESLLKNTRDTKAFTAVLELKNPSFPVSPKIGGTNK